MNLYVEGSIATIKPDTTIRYTVENPLFTQSEGFTLEIVLPLRDCDNNIAIFGDIYRTDQTIQESYAARIEHGKFSKEGTLHILEVTESEIHAQFLDGLADSNKAQQRLKELYIHKLSIPMPDYETYTTKVEDLRYKVEDLAGIDGGYYWLGLEWINNYSGNRQNRIWKTNTDRGWLGREMLASPRTFCPYMIELATLIADHAGYLLDATPWRAHPQWRYLVCCNMLPLAWGVRDYAVALPHISVSDFFDDLAALMGCIFFFDHQTQTITMRFYTDYYTDQTMYKELSRVVSQHTRTIDNEAVVPAYQNNIIKYNEGNVYISKYHQTQMPPQNAEFPVNEQNTLREVVREFNTNPGNINTIWYSERSSTYYVPYVDSVTKPTDPNAPDGYSVGIHLIMAGYHHTPDIEGVKQKEVVFCPVAVDTLSTRNPQWNSSDAADSPIMILDSGEFDSETELSPENPKSNLQQLIENGTIDNEPYSTIYIGFWKGLREWEYNAEYELHAAPIIEPEYQKIWNTEEGPLPADAYDTGFTLLNPIANYRARAIEHMPLIRRYEQLELQFIENEVPDINSIFYINSQPWICAKLETMFLPAQGTPTNTPNHSLLIKGTFYRLLTLN